MEKAVVLFDGVCNFCVGSVQFIYKRDPKGRFRFASLQSEAGQALLREHRLPADDFDSMVLIEGDRVHLRSSAALQVARGLKAPWSLLGIFLVIPRPVRDLAYRLIAGNRYRLFGKRESCMVPTPDFQARFL